VQQFQVDSHLACVNCVRWSNSGKYLASGGDDKVVMVWTLTKYPNSGNIVFGTKNVVNIETWKCIFTLRSHSGDILDLAWSPRDTYLASCSVDNTIIIWDAQKFPTVHKVLSGHTGLVKGVSWDPIGKYLSSQSDDKSLRIWRTSDWQTDTIVTAPFKECGGNTAVLRHSWSPDGQYLVSAHAMNNTGPVAKVIERDGWKCDKDYVGHRKAINCVRFSCSIMLRKIGKKKQNTCLCAVGSRDSNISVWLTSLKRPIVVLENLFQGPVLDLSWSKNGLNMYACSFDGTISILMFDQNDIGKALSDQEKNSICEKMYGVSLLERHNNTLLIENPAILKMNGVQPPVEVKNVDSTKEIKQLTKNVVKPSLPVLKKQIETRTSDGRRRITPIFIPPTSDNAEEINVLPFSSSSESKSRVVVERVNDIIEPNISNSCSNFSQESQTPTIIDSTIPKNVPSSVLQVSPNKGESKKKADPVTASSSLFLTKKMKSNPVEDNLTTDVKSSFVPTTVQTQKFKVLDHSSDRIVVENNKCNTANGPISKIKVYSNNVISWEKVFSSNVLKYCSNKTLSLIIVGLSNCTIHVMESKNGLPICPPYVLSSPIKSISSNNHFLLCLMQNSFSVWNIHKQECVLHEEKLNTLVCSNKNKPVVVKKCMLTENGTLIITLTTGNSYMYSISAKCWMMIGDSGDAVYSYSSQKNKHISLKSNSDHPLNVMQVYSSKYESNLGVKDTEGISELCSKTFLEQQMSAALALESDKEYKYWLLAYVSFLTDREDSVRLRYLCQDLLGVSHGFSNHKKIETILGMSKHELLKEVLVIVAGSRSTQRVFTEFHDQLKEMSEL